MYHYVRKYDPEFPNLRFLDFEDFKKQLDHFECIYNFPTREQVVKYMRTPESQILNQDRPSMVLTFDDGLFDHYAFVLPELKRRGLWGIFYVPSGPYANDSLLDVHAVHALTARFDSKRLLERARELITNEAVAVFSDKQEEFEEHTYRPELQTNDEATVEFKRLCNYFLRPHVRSSVLKQMLAESFSDVSSLCKSWYLSIEQLKVMDAAGMWIGAHSVTHAVLGSLSETEQRSEIEPCFEFIECVLGKHIPRTFCFPYGGPVAHNVDTIKILREANCLFTVDVRYEDCTVELVSKFPQELPRWDCNKFLFGSCRDPKSYVQGG